MPTGERPCAWMARALWRARRPAGRLAGALLLLAAGVSTVAAQASKSVVATPVQDLSWGGLAPGVVDHVSITDAARRGAVLLDGQGTVDAQFILPTALLSARGDRLPLSFGTADLGVADGPTAAPVAYDPSQPQHIHLRGKGAQIWLYLGGTADASVPIPAGDYSATVVLVISKPNA